MRDLFGDGIFAADGDKWLAQRKTASHMFAAREFREVTLPPPGGVNPALPTA
jgi:hypothetical protein